MKFDNYEWHKNTIEIWEKKDKEGTLEQKFKEKLPKLKKKFERMKLERER